MNKEFRFYVLSCFVTEDISHEIIQKFKDYEDQHEELSEGAKSFISLCEQEGDVYSIEGFQEAFNMGFGLSSDVHFIYITNRY